MSAIRVDFQSALMLNYLSQVMSRVGDPQPLLYDIGELLTETTKRRFDTSTAPDGSRWSANTDVTVLRYLGVFKGKKAGRGGSKKPLVGETKSLMSTIYYDVGPGTVRIGSPMVYSAMQQFGGTKSDYPHLWADIPARPFLGLSANDREGILDLVASYLGS